MGTTSRRFATCNSQMRGVPLKPGDDDYRDVEYYPVLYGQRPADLRAGRPSVTSGGITMRKLIQLAVASFGRGGFATAAFAASADDFKAALAKAEAANKQAARDQEPVDDDGRRRLKAAAKTAADAGKFDDAVKLAQHAEASRQCLDRAGQGAGKGSGPKAVDPLNSTPLELRRLL